MAREVVVRTWCDRCLVDDRHVEAEEIGGVVLPGIRGARVVALCGPCREDVYTPFEALVRDQGQVATAEGLVEPPRRRGRPPSTVDAALPCPRCDAGPFSTAKRLADHARKQHDMTAAELRGQPRKAADVACPEPGCDRVFTSGQGLALHRRRGHQAA